MWVKLGDPRYKPESKVYVSFFSMTKTFQSTSFIGEPLDYANGGLLYVYNCRTLFKYTYESVRGQRSPKRQASKQT